MKKNILLSMMLLGAMCASAQNANVVVNGDFEAEFEEYNPYSWDFTAAKSVPGWELSTSGIWNGNVRILDQEPDGDIIMDDNYQYARLERKDDNGWANISMTQTIGVVPNTEYTLSFLSRYNDGERSDWMGDREQGIVIYDKEEGGVELVKSLVDNAGWAYTKDITFTPKSEKIILKLYCNNPNWNKVKNKNSYVEFDDVQIVGDASAATGVASVTVGNANAKSEVYDMAGRRVATTSLNALRASGKKGVFIVKQGDKAEKVVVK